jgi:sensor domain CHASE-containing protein
MDLKSLLIAVVVVAVLVAVALTLIDFRTTPSAREHVLAFVRHIQTDSLPDLGSFLIVDSVAAGLYTDPEFDTLSAAERITRCREDFQREGRYRQMFTRSQVVVNREEPLDDSTASVEVSYINRQTRIQYYTQMLLRRQGTGWAICRLRIQ